MPMKTELLDRGGLLRKILSKPGETLAGSPGRRVGLVTIERPLSLLISRKLPFRYRPMLSKKPL
jgi:hypothetical protein